MTDFTIANGASLSSAIRLGGALPCGIFMPSAWTAASLTFQVSVDGATFNDLYDDSGTEVAVTVAASRFVLFSNVMQYLAMAPETYLKVRSGTSGAAVAQGGDRVIKIILRRAP